MRNLWEEFREFAVGGNLVQLAVAFVLGLAFAAVVSSAVDDLFMPIIGGIVSDRSFSNLTLNVGGAQLRYGSFIATSIYFVTVAAILFIIVKGYTELLKRDEEEAVVETKTCPFCATDIPLAATRCPNCTSALEGVAN